jgi:hypothetical protein
MNDIIDTIENKTEHKYKSILFIVTMFIVNNRLYLKVTFNNKKEILKEVKKLSDISKINETILKIIVDRQQLLVV